MMIKMATLQNSSRENVIKLFKFLIKEKNVNHLNLNAMSYEDVLIWTFFMINPNAPFIF